jgi:SAM-dependent methyltransferase
MALAGYLSSNGIRRAVNRLLRPLDLGIYRPSAIDALVLGEISHVPVELPEGARETLTPDNPRILELKRRYRGHPAAKASAWSEARLVGKLDLAYFRGDNQFLYQARATDAAAYALTALHLREHDPLGLLDRFYEDGAFGALTHIVEGKVVSRDLLDSVVEINYLAEKLGADRLAKARVLDIGAGYGRLAHRLNEWSGDIEVLCSDAVPISSFLCEYYLRHRSVEGARSLPLDEVAAALPVAGVDLAVNVHSFAEAPRAAVAWWLERVAAAEVPHLLIVHGEPELFTAERDLSRGSYDDVLQSLGYERDDLRPKYPHSETLQRLGVFPAWYHWFTRR